MSAQKMLCLAKLLWAEAFPGEPMLKCKDCTVSDKCDDRDDKQTPKQDGHRGEDRARK